MISKGIEINKTTLEIQLKKKIENLIIYEDYNKSKEYFKKSFKFYKKSLEILRLNEYKKDYIKITKNKIELFKLLFQFEEDKEEIITIELRIQDLIINILEYDFKNELTIELAEYQHREFERLFKVYEIEAVQLNEMNIKGLECLKNLQVCIDYFFDKEIKNENLINSLFNKAIILSKIIVNPVKEKSNLINALEVLTKVKEIVLELKNKKEILNNNLELKLKKALELHHKIQDRIKKSKVITELDLEQITQINLQKLFDKHSENLESIEIRAEQEHKIDITNTYFPKLKKINLYAVELKTINFTKENTPLLETLTLDNCLDVDEFILDLPNLESISLEHVTVLNSENFGVSISNCKKLKFIHFHKVWGLGSSSLQKLILPNCIEAHFTRSEDLEKISLLVSKMEYLNFEGAYGLRELKIKTKNWKHGGNDCELDPEKLTVCLINTSVRKKCLKELKKNKIIFIKWYPDSDYTKYQQEFMGGFF